MTRARINEQGRRAFNHPAWQMLIDRALRHGWEPAGARGPDPRDGPEEGDAFGEDDLVDPPRERQQAREVPADHPLARAVRSLLPRPGDLVLGSYFNNAGFRVTAEDARALANALGRALPDVPAHDAVAHKAVKRTGAPGERFLPFGTPVDPSEWFSGPNKPRPDASIRFGRRGGFAMW